MLLSPKNSNLIKQTQKYTVSLSFVTGFVNIRGLIAKAFDGHVRKTRNGLALTLTLTLALALTQAMLLSQITWTIFHQTQK